MSELINNRENIKDRNERQEKMKEVIKDLHAGKTVEEVKEKFAEVIDGVTAKEISMMEVSLVKDGLPIEEIQRLCDVHAEVFKGSIEEIHHPEDAPGHPIYTLRQENIALENLIDNDLTDSLRRFLEDDSDENRFGLISQVNLLWDLDKHYARKENLIFPYLEKYGITAPPQVMWGVDDEIRDKIKDLKDGLTNYNGKKEAIAKRFELATNQIKDMIFKEESILFPMCLDTLTEDEWICVYNESPEIGYAFTPPMVEWHRARVDLEGKAEEEGLGENKGYIKFETGILTPKEINHIFNTIPGDMTFVDKNNIVKYFSQGKDRLFPRAKTVIGRTVENCHPPASVDVVQIVVDDLKSGKKDMEQFWIKMGGKYILIQYFAVRDEDGEFLGVLEFSQNIGPIQEIAGEKRLLSE